MSLISIFLLALALAVDSFAASVGKGARLYRPTIWQALFVGILFGGVQVLMPLLGWQIGLEIQPMVKSFDHWIAFGILSAVGAKMIFEGLHKSENGYGSNFFTISALMLTAIATSIDSLVVGFGFGFLNISVLVALLMIGGVTFLVSVGGVYLGNHLSAHFGEYAEIVAGLVLIIFGFQILLEHTQFFSS